MQIRPGDHVPGADRCHSAQPQPAQYRAEPHLHADHLQAGSAGPAGDGQHHIGHPGQPLPGDVDHLGVEHVAGQQDLVAGQGVDRRRGRSGSQYRPARLEPGHRRPGQQLRRSAAAADQQTVDQLRTVVAVEAHSQVDQPADHPVVSGAGDPHLTADELG